MNNKKQESPSEKKGPNILYNVISVSITIIGIVLLILSQVLAIDFLFFISLGILGLGIMLLVQKSVYKQSATKTENSEKKSDENLSLRKRG